MERVLEPELMEDQQQAIAYASTDFSSSDQWFTDRVFETLPQGPIRVIDLGCGTGNVLVRLAKALPDARITAVDGSEAMIALAKNAIANLAIDNRIRACLHIRTAEKLTRKFSTDLEKG